VRELVRLAEAVKIDVVFLGAWVRSRNTLLRVKPASPPKNQHSKIAARVARRLLAGR
jgi:hypothetical protein